MSSTFSYTSTPTSYYSSSYHPALHCRSSIPSDYLPNDEYRYLVKRQDRSRLEAHFAQPSHTSSYAMPRTAYQEQVNLGSSRRAQISGTAYATRAALGSGFDFTDEGFDHIQTASDLQSRSTSYYELGSDEEPIPARYIAEFNEKLRDAERRCSEHERCSDDYTAFTSRRTHSGTYSAARSSEPPKPTPPRGERHDSGFEKRIVYGPTPTVQSKFNWSSSDNDDEPLKRSFWGRAHRSRKPTERRTW
jgi:hypothetical protein